MLLFKRILQEERGSTMIMFVLVLVVILGVTSMAVDAGNLYFSKRNAQNVADAAALAGARKLPNKVESENLALEYIEDFNKLSPSNVKAEFNHATDPDEITITITVREENFFARVLGFATSDVVATATAGYRDRIISGEEALKYANNVLWSDTLITFSLSDFSLDGNAYSNQDIKIVPSNNDKTDIENAKFIAHGTVKDNNDNKWDDPDVEIINEGPYWYPEVAVPDYPAVSHDYPDNFKKSDSLEDRTIIIESGKKYEFNTGKKGVDWEDAVITFSGDLPGGVIWIDGDLDLSNATITGAGYIIADGKIDLGKVNQDPSDYLSIISYYEGNQPAIKITENNFTYSGLLFAQNDDIMIQSKINLTGNIWGKTGIGSGSSDGNFAKHDSADAMVIQDNWSFRVQEFLLLR